MVRVSWKVIWNCVALWAQDYIPLINIYEVLFHDLSNCINNPLENFAIHILYLQFSLFWVLILLPDNFILEVPVFYMKVTENSHSLFHDFNSYLASLCLSQLYYLLPGINRLEIQGHHGLTWWQLFLVLIFISFAIAFAFPFVCFWASVATPLAICYSLPIRYPQWGPVFPQG